MMWDLMDAKVPNQLKGQYCLNSFHIIFSSDEFQAAVVNEISDDHIKELRATHGKEWFFLRRAPDIWALPLVSNPQHAFPDKRTLTAKKHDGLTLLKARFNEVLPDIVKSYEPHRLRPFSFLAQRNELIEAAEKLRYVAGDPFPQS